MKKWQRTMALFLLMMFLHNLGGYYWVYRVLRKQAKKEMKSYIRNHYADDEGMTVFSWAETKSFRWTDAHEFEYNGAMYDVVTVEQNDGSVLLHCVKDEREKELINDFLVIQDMLEDDEEERKEKKTHPKHWLKKQKKEIHPPVFFAFSCTAVSASCNRTCVPGITHTGHIYSSFPPPKT